mmetsp:Transcript_1795/g.7834  ORF Transcript_1795/g.7834 Transcript_1795/m.7834 type:complete len:352 (+) Transcript_1795:6582-7637(+)
MEHVGPRDFEVQRRRRENEAGHLVNVKQARPVDDGIPQRLGLAVVGVRREERDDVRAPASLHFILLDHGVVVGQDWRLRSVIDGDDEPADGRQIERIGGLHIDVDDTVEELGVQRANQRDRAVRIDLDKLRSCWAAQGERDVIIKVFVDDDVRIDVPQDHREGVVLVDEERGCRREGRRLRHVADVNCDRGRRREGAREVPDASVGDLYRQHDAPGVALPTPKLVFEAVQGRSGLCQAKRRNERIGGFQRVRGARAVGHQLEHAQAGGECRRCAIPNGEGQGLLFVRIEGEDVHQVPGRVLGDRLLHVRNRRSEVRLHRRNLVLPRVGQSLTIAELHSDVCRLALSERGAG